MYSFKMQDLNIIENEKKKLGKRNQIWVENGH